MISQKNTVSYFGVIFSKHRQKSVKRKYTKTGLGCVENYFFDNVNHGFLLVKECKLVNFQR